MEKVLGFCFSSKMVGAEGGGIQSLKIESYSPIDRKDYECSWVQRAK